MKTVGPNCSTLVGYLARLCVLTPPARPERAGAGAVHDDDEPRLRNTAAASNTATGMRYAAPPVLFVPMRALYVTTVSLTSATSEFELHIELCVNSALLWPYLVTSPSACSTST
jgi:hypothetical protein